MSASGKPFIPLTSPKDHRPASAFSGPGGLKSLIRDCFSLTTWLALGAVVQAVLSLTLSPRLAFLPAFLLLSYRALTAYATSIGWLHNPLMDGVIRKKFSAQIPDEVGDFGTKPSNQDIVVLLIGTRCNHPLGALSEGARGMLPYFPRMAKDLDTHAEEFGFLGMTSWLNSSAREAQNEIMDVAYFRTVEGLTAFAHSQYHTDAWTWWNNHTKKYPYLSIFHEVYHSPAGHWENIYVNSHLCDFASTQYRYVDQTSGKDMWTSPVVDASKGLLRSSRGRMAHGSGMEHGPIGMEGGY
ncbi:hypothetical protein LTR62_004037 [Meristemomyces frigidus]|uniref:Uncharacterized protein n=1 Tax=Meristemomyces frigidus TaxID=1508187 RepID=A0AAN7YKI8_9PEZI|nr:hypothetical protein LTR62_004037 [Meristemomyces frigidus]